MREPLSRLATKPDSEIDFSDIPRLTDEQLAQMVHFPASFQDHPDLILAWLKSKGPGHLSRINSILANVMDAEQRLKSA